MNKFIKVIKNKILSFGNKIKANNILGKKFNNLKFKTKLFLGFGAVILVFLLGSGVNILFLNNINNSVENLEVAGDNMHYILKLATIVRGKYIDAIDLVDNNRKAKAVRHFNNHEKEFQKVIDHLKNQVKNKDIEFLLEELISLNQTYNDIFNKQLIPVWRIKNGEKLSNYSGIVNYRVPMVALVNTRDDMIQASNSLNRIFVEERESFLNIFNQNLGLTGRSFMISIISTIIMSLVIIRLLENNLVNTLEKLANYSREIASGNLKVEKLKIRTDDQIEDLARSFNIMVDNLCELLSNISNASNEVTGFSQELSSLSIEVDATINSASSIIDDMSEGVDQLAVNSQEVMDFSYEVVNITQEGHTKIRSSVDQMIKIEETVENVAEVVGEFSKQSEEIGKITELIDRIADQTNLLALNASIEAARAGFIRSGSRESSRGEAGSGFAVVAEEIRNLAKETSNATNNIDSLIREIQSKSKEAIKAITTGKKESQAGERIIKEAGEAFKLVNNAIDDTVTHIEETTASTEELAAGSQQVLEVTDEVKSISQQVTKESEKLSMMAENLNNLVQNFNL
ncbi:methyl-accepting chemotaxis protein [Orenia marismortui]|uniref:Methyl-accepting chemotaxis protein n=1 Tax=Orenia marismortui TaxID=46469 RepID=A0A4R8H0D6_9FIRM|nr:HAMP domain-containing methyl-accepting chemotaxis protein [Orenia marismortui]TDX52658.1 methyl-accepting chemotaxis protein [Orenia marismortui]